MLKTKVQVACKNGHVGEISLPMPVNRLSVGGRINVTDQNCPSCGERMSAPGGEYERNEDGLLVRVGDFVEQTPPS